METLLESHIKAAPFTAVQTRSIRSMRIHAPVACACFLRVSTAVPVATKTIQRTRGDRLAGSPIQKKGALVMDLADRLLAAACAVHELRPQRALPAQYRGRHFPARELKPGCCRGELEERYACAMASWPAFVTCHTIATGQVEISMYAAAASIARRPSQRRRPSTAQHRLPKLKQRSRSVGSRRRAIAWAPVRPALRRPAPSAR